MNLFGLVLGNPAGAWALLGLPVILAIHLLQRRRRRIVVTTLFLVEPLAVEGLRGRRIERLHRSTSLWLQLAAVTALAVLLMRPQVAAEQARLRCVVVLDASASMAAFRDRALEAVHARLDTVTAARVDWVVTETSLRRPALYTGPDRARADAALAAWQPRLGSHDPAPALTLARGLAGDGGRVIFVTNHAVEAVPGVERLAVGAPTANVGFAGADVQEKDGRTAWTGLVRNHGAAAAHRTVTVEGQSAPVASLALGPGEIARVTGAFPDGARALTLRLESDALTLDDRLPLVRPERKRVRVMVDPAARKLPFVARFLESATGVVAFDAPAAGTAAPAHDLVITRDPGVARAAIVLVAAPTPRAAPQGVVAAPHPLTDDLAWSALLVGPAGPHRPAGSDERLLASEGRPLVWVHPTDGGPQLVVGFDIERSNAARVPAFVVMVHRFLEEVRDGIPGHESRNVEADEELSVAARRDGGALAVVGADGRAMPAESSLLRAPDEPGFFRVRQGGEDRLTAAAHFADAAEADLTRASALADPVPAAKPQASRETAEVAWAPLLVLALGGLIAADGLVREEGA